MFEVSFSQSSRLNSFFLLVSALLMLVQWFVYTLCRGKFVLSFVVVVVVVLFCLLLFLFVLFFFVLFVCFSSDGQG